MSMTFINKLFLLIPTEKIHELETSNKVEILIAGTTIKEVVTKQELKKTYSLRPKHMNRSKQKVQATFHVSWTQLTVKCKLNSISLFHCKSSWGKENIQFSCNAVSSLKQCLASSESHCATHVCFGDLHVQNSKPAISKVRLTESHIERVSHVDNPSSMSLTKFIKKILSHRDYEDKPRAWKQHMDVVWQSQTPCYWHPSSPEPIDHKEILAENTELLTSSEVYI